WIDSRNLVRRQRNERLPGHSASDHYLGQALSRVASNTSLTVEVLPKTTDILLQIAQDQIGPVMPEIGFPGIIHRTARGNSFCGSATGSSSGRSVKFPYSFG